MNLDSTVSSDLPSGICLWRSEFCNMQDFFGWPVLHVEGWQISFLEKKSLVTWKIAFMALAFFKSHFKKPLKNPTYHLKAI